jgi:hypothetical protein
VDTIVALECAEGRDELAGACEVEALRASHTAALDQQRAATREACAELARFKVLVRERALRRKEDESWCDAGFNVAMRGLGLPELVRRYRVRMVVDMTVEDTDSPEVAQSWACEALDSSDSDVRMENLRYRIRPRQSLA